MNILDDLFKNHDLKYRDFICKLTPTIKKENVIGVRMPIIRSLAKKYFNTDEGKEFLNRVPHKYYEENILHSSILCLIKDVAFIYDNLEKFLPYIDNWAVCDTLSPKILFKDPDTLLKHILLWVKSNKTYTIRFGIDCLMDGLLDKNYKTEYLKIPARIHSDEYYVNMAIAWYYATALAKQYESTIKVIESKILDPWIQNKTIQKAIESFRITDEQKEYLRTLKKQK